MKGLVFIIISLLSESFSSLFSLIRLLSCMNPNMVDEIPSFVKLSVTVVILANEIPQDSSGCLVMLVHCFILVVLHWSNIRFLHIVILWW